jgi:UTP--glucose-1-phosphate uridylyltransferase
LTFKILFQRDAFGNGQAVLEGAKAAPGEPLAVRFCDDILVHEKPALKSLGELFRAHGAPVFVLERVPKILIPHYGVVAVRRRVAPLVHEVSKVVEKPKVQEVLDTEGLSGLAVVGAYVVTPSVIRHLARLAPFAPPLGDSLPLTSAFHHELAHGGKIYGWEFPGKRLDCGTLEGLEKAEEFLKTIEAKTPSQ